MPKQPATNSEKGAKGGSSARQQDAGEIGYDMIATAAYYRAERNGFQGNDVEHWLEAERELRAKLRH